MKMKILQCFRSNMTAWITWAVLIWCIASSAIQGSDDHRFRERFDTLEAELKTYESVKVLDSRQEDRLEELLAEMETYKPTALDIVRPDPRF